MKLRKLGIIMLMLALLLQSTCQAAEFSSLLEKLLEAVRPAATLAPSAEPTVEPSPEPTPEPTAEPSMEPGVYPSVEPTAEPSANPSFGPTIAPETPAAEIIPGVDYLVLGVGERTVLPPYALLPEGTQDSVVFSCDASGLAVTKDGMLNPKKAGSYTLLLQAAGGAAAEIPVTVCRAPGKITLEADRSSLSVGESLLVSAKLPENSAGSYTITSSDENVLRPDAGGGFLAVSPGSAKITAKTYNGKTSTLKVKVYAAPEFISLNAAELAIGAGDVFALSPVLSEGSPTEIIYSSSDAAIAAVDADGIISAVSPGDAVITAETYNGLSASCAVRVCPAPEEIILRVPSTELGLNESVQIEAEFLPEGSMASLSFRSSNDNYISVSKTGMVKALRTRTATITAQSHNGVQQKLKLSVLDAPKSISLSLSERAIAIGGTAYASCSLPEGSAGGYSLSTDAPEIIRLSPEGFITALKSGTASITATSYNGKTDSARITVLDVPEEIFLDSEMKMGLGSIVPLLCSLPEGSGSPLFYESLNPDIVSVDAGSGMLTALRLGDAGIRVYAVNSPAMAECTVHVLPAPEQMILAETEITLYEGQSRALECSFLPEDSYGAISCQPANPAIVDMDEFGSLIGLREGSTSVTISSYNGLQAQLRVNVLEAPKWISLNRSHLNLSSGESFALEYTLPAGAHSSVRYASSNPEIAAVDESSGLVTALSTGTAFITASTLNGQIASCTVNVNIDLEPADTVSGDFEITFMDIGRNDGILISCGGEYAFVDSGVYSYGEKAVEFLKKRGVTKLKYYIATHAHDDHIGGSAAILEAFPVDMILVPHSYCYEVMLELCKTAQQKAIMESTPNKVFTLGQQLYLGGAKITCLGPVTVKHYHYSSSAENNNSLVTRITYGENSFLLTGDATRYELAEILDLNPDALLSDLLKNPHHDQYLPDYVINKVKPKITVFSTSNAAWPDWSYMNELRKLGSQIYSTATAMNGNVHVRSDGTNISVTPQRGEVMRDYRD